MPSVRSLASKRRAYIVVLIFLLGEIMPTCSRCAKKRLVCITIAAPSGCQLSFYLKCTKLNIYSSCNVQSVFNVKYISSIS